MADDGQADRAELKVYLVGTRGFKKLGKVDRDGQVNWFAQPVTNPVISDGDILILNGKVQVAHRHPHYGFSFEVLDK